MEMDLKEVLIACAIGFGAIIVIGSMWAAARYLIVRRMPPLIPLILTTAIGAALIVAGAHYPHYLGLAYPPQICHLVEIADSVNDGYIEGIYDCDDMSIAFWEEATAQGYQVRIAVGNIDEDITYVHESDHAWCLVWVEDVPLLYEEGWLAIEVTGAFPVFPKDNPLYYQGGFYDTPSEMPPM